MLTNVRVQAHSSSGWGKCFLNFSQSLVILFLRPDHRRLSDRVVKVMHSKCIGKFPRRFKSCGSRDVFCRHTSKSHNFVLSFPCPSMLCPFSLVVEHSLRKRKVPRSIRGGGRAFFSPQEKTVSHSKFITPYILVDCQTAVRCSDSSVGRAFGCYF